MRPPAEAEVDDALDKLERTRMEIVDDGPQWQSDAERLNLPRVNTTTGTGAPLLDRDAVLAKSLPDCVGLR